MNKRLLEVQAHAVEPAEVVQVARRVRRVEYRPAGRRHHAEGARQHEARRPPRGARERLGAARRVHLGLGDGNLGVAPRGDRQQLPQVEAARLLGRGRKGREEAQRERNPGRHVPGRKATSAQEASREHQERTAQEPLVRRRGTRATFVPTRQGAEGLGSSSLTATAACDPASLVANSLRIATPGDAATPAHRPEPRSASHPDAMAATEVARALHPGVGVPGVRPTLA